MSPLAHSLLALAALIAAADAQGQCSEKDVGQLTGRPVPLTPPHVYYPGGTVVIPDGDVCRNGRLPIGEKIVCCNSSQDPTIPPPTIDDPPYPPYFSPFNVHVYDRAGCDCSITQYCPY